MVKVKGRVGLQLYFNKFNNNSDFKNNLQTYILLISDFIFGGKCNFR